VQLNHLEGVKPESIIKLNKFVARPYQLPMLDALENKGYKKLICVWHRRAGKDVVAFNIMIRQALKKVGTYYYILPTYKQARLVLFYGMTNEGKPFLDYIPPELIAPNGVNKSEMKIKLINSSLIYFVGSENYDSLRGTNPSGIVFSEFAYQHPSVYATLKPIVLANNGWMIFISTPFGENFFYTLYEVAKNSEDWFTSYLTVDDTGIVTPEQIDNERKEGLISEDMIQQEYYCSYKVGAQGSYYARYLNKMELEDRIGDVPWEAAFKVHTAWDLGMADQMVILWYQTIGQTVRIIDCYANSDLGLEHYVSILNTKPYTYGKHFGPHDIAVRELQTGMSRVEKARQLGIKFEMRDGKSAVPNIPIIDGIEAVRSAFSKIWIDKDHCGPLITAIRDYRKEYDALRKVYKDHPLHDRNSDYADALRYLVLSLPRTRDGNSAEELDKRYQEVVYGTANKISGFFREDI